MKLLSAHQMKELDDYTVKSQGISSDELMERASRAVADEIISLLPATATNVVVFAGPGNNGGDGLAVARMLGHEGRHVEVFLFNTKGRLSDDCRCNWDRLQKSENVETHEITSQFDLPQLGADDWIVDALFGIGLSHPLAGGFKLLVDFINSSGNKVVSVDMPSGLPGAIDRVDSEERELAAVRADYTFTFHCLKPTMLLAESQRFLGKVKVLDIGLNDINTEYESLQFAVTEQSQATKMLIPRAPFGNKGTFGHGLLVAGARGMAGAAILSGRAACRSGIGKLSVLTAEENLAVLQTALPEAVVATIAADTKADKAADGMERLLDQHSYSAVAIGPGLGQGPKAEAVVFGTIGRKDLRLIVDADGLNILAKHADWVSLLPKGAILTPHPKEWERLMGIKANDVAKLRSAMDCCAQFGIYIILKGHYTAVCTPDRRVFFNTSGNNGMATAGSGDVLTGILLGLLSQGYSAEDACRLGVWLHGKAGDYAREQLTEYSMTALDIIGSLGDAFKTIIK
jgi:ADP-dependent NAD(P)H-hydrate dehydratase / NAD(P)H-hydrate epimerase